MMEPGDELIYRLRDFEPSERVRIIAEHPGKQSSRYDVEFLDGRKAGKVENVPERRLRGSWADVASYDELMKNWARLAQSDVTLLEEIAVERVFRLLIASEIARGEWKPVRWATRILDKTGLEECIGLPLIDLLAEVEWFELDGELLVSPAGTLAIAEAACRMHPTPILDLVVSEEKDYREFAKRGRDVKHPLSGQPAQTSPDWEYRRYVEHARPLHELLRAWCGHRAVTAQERLAAAEAEIQRLDQLVVRLIEELRPYVSEDEIGYLIREHDEERITSNSHRPVVERPLEPFEVEAGRWRRDR